MLLRKDTGEFGFAVLDFVAFFSGLFTTTQTVGSSLGDLASGGMPGAQGRGPKRQLAEDGEAERRTQKEEEEEAEGVGGGEGRGRKRVLTHAG